MVILGTEYAGEMKKGILTIMCYLMPVKYNILTLHSSVNEGKNGEVTLFFGLSGTGKTTLSADPARYLIGDDEHCWSDHGLFNVEGGCYAKCIGLSPETDPEIFNALQFGAVLENVVFDPKTRVVDYNDSIITENTRAAYPIEFISHSKVPCVSTHPTNIILLTCDASGVLPLVSKLDRNQLMYHFISGYTSKVPGTEQGVSSPEATFSACFGQPFLVLHPIRYAQLLSEKILQHKVNAWLVNTGWTGRSVMKGGKRCPLKYTRAILDAIHDGSLAKADYETLEIFNLQVPVSCPGVPTELLNPAKSEQRTAKEFHSEIFELAKLFIQNFEHYKSQASTEIIAGGPTI
jgi:phosphoenolpyruvate carboxykinase (ATP)